MLHEIDRRPVATVYTIFGGKTGKAYERKWTQVVLAPVFGIVVRKLGISGLYMWYAHVTLFHILIVFSLASVVITTPLTDNYLGKYTTSALVTTGSAVVYPLLHTGTAE
jgi:hypothetical protein